jgi:hypothetical protein
MAVNSTLDRRDEVMHCFLLNAILLGGLSACGTYEIETKPPEVVSPELAPYVADFYEYIKDIGLGTQTFPVGSVTFAATAPYQSSAREGHGSVIGVCIQASITKGRDSAQVFIDPAFWDMASEGSRYTIVFHEMIHCALHRNLKRHDEYGLMKPQLDSPEISMMEFRQYVRNYFGQ